MEPQITNHSIFKAISTKYYVDAGAINRVLFGRRTRSTAE